MELHDTTKINSFVKQISFTEIITPFAYDKKKMQILGRVSISFEGLPEILEFDVKINPQYPFRSHDMESIKFLNKELLEYNHVMGDGTICIHTTHSFQLEKKLNIDFLSLKEWITKYYINKSNDTHYEHLIVEKEEINGKYFAYLFTDVDYKFKKNEFGLAIPTHLNNGRLNEKDVHTYIVKKFINEYGDELASCKWSNSYKKIRDKDTQGIFVFTENSPSIHNRFILKDWGKFKDLFSSKFLKFLHHCEKSYLKEKLKGSLIPLFIGYKISNLEIHWQIAMLKVGDFPIHGTKENQKWDTKLSNGNINWALTRNSSYKYFFGRGTFCDDITNKKILIIGVGAVGSIIAKTLTKGGCKKLDIADYDIKEPENVCRSEYQFFSGINEKVIELSEQLSIISPFIDIKIVNQSYFEIVTKAFYKDANSKKELEKFLNSYDLIFDCSTDNDLMYVLNSLEIKSDLINLSITNHAKNLVCAFYPNVYNFVTKQFSKILDNDTVDLYNPTGCWDPTFKASYNDISVLVQHSMKQINLIYKDKLPKTNFVLETSTEREFTIKLKEY